MGDIAKKSTDELLQELEGSTEFIRYYGENREEFLDQSLSQALNALLEEKGLTKGEIFRKADLSEDYGFQIFSGLRRPSRGKLLGLAVAMDLALPEVQQLLKLSGHAPLYVRNEFDCIVTYGIFHRQSVMEINEALYDYLGKTLTSEK